MCGIRLAALPDHTWYPDDSNWCPAPAKRTQSLKILHDLRGEIWCFPVRLLVGLPEELPCFA